MKKENRAYRNGFRQLFFDTFEGLSTSRRQYELYLCPAFARLQGKLTVKKGESEVKTLVLEKNFSKKCFWKKKNKRTLLVSSRD